ncbi:jg15357, partial [Pararge aegeria aegeria]
CNGSYYEITANKSSEFSALISTHISLPSEIIVATLVNEDQFLKLIFLKEINELRDAQLLGYLLLVITTMKAFLENENVPKENNEKIIACVFSMLPYCKY